MNKAITPAQLTRQAYRFGQQVLAAGSVRLTQRIPKDGTVERITIRLYVGAELQLQVKPYVTNERGQDRPLIYFINKKFVDGDDDKFIFEIREPVRVDEILVVEATNTSGVSNYDFSVDIEVDYMGGTWPSR